MRFSIALLTQVNAAELPQKVVRAGDGATRLGTRHFLGGGDGSKQRDDSIGSYRKAVIQPFQKRLERVGYRQDDAPFPRIWFQADKEDALRTGAALHDTRHDDYDDFVRRKYIEIARKAIRSPIDEVRMEAGRER